MFVLRVTPVRNVLIGKRCFKSEKPDMFFNKVVEYGAKVEVYDVSDRKNKTLNVSEINKRNHRMIINDKKYFICSISDAGEKRKAI
ncbi:hypothetical protein [Acetivibrio cellulolyticus]|uniref:hypothetical protein n=1 Tax=Acetivibrio cellulolyticus TaxID=35830 RepID=UPI0001E2DE7D|nr:hypothetical protein [Acetivibrio cellulolyticus]